MTNHIVQTVKVRGIDDTSATLLDFNNEAFAFSREKLEALHEDIGQRLSFLRLLDKAGKPKL